MIMRKLSVPVKSGFRITKPEIPVNIRDCRGLMFYTTEYLVPKVKEFNLPPGDYLVDGGYFTQMGEPIEYPLKKLPPHERERAKPHNFRIDWGINPNKCSIIWNEKRILFDNSLQDFTLPELYFILYHEYSHANYQTEKFCDLKAYNYMILKGFNPAQIGMSQIDSLSDKQYKRKAFLTNIITSNKFDQK